MANANYLKSAAYGAALLTPLIGAQAACPTTDKILQYTATPTGIESKVTGRPTMTLQPQWMGSFKVDFKQNLEVGYRGENAVYVIADGVRTDFYKCDGTDAERTADSDVGQARLVVLKTKAASAIHMDVFARIKHDMEQDKK